MNSTKTFIFAVLLFMLPCVLASAQNQYKEEDNISYINVNDTSVYRRERCKLICIIQVMLLVHSRQWCGFMVVD